MAIDMSQASLEATLPQLTAAPAVGVSVIIPTYREADNLPVLIPLISTALRQADLPFEILIVDDASPDGTPQVCQQLAEDYPVTLLVRTHERGLSSAVIHGMQQARGEVLVVMDADLSHPPEKVPELIQAIGDEAADFVIGSRYVAGGAVEQGWGLLRWLNSQGATLLARPLTSAKDPMAGFFAIRRSSFEQAAALDPVGYKIGLELLVKCGCRRVHEVPITFRNRLHGESKLTLREQLDYLRHLKRLYEYKLGRMAQPAQFLLVGATGMVVDLIMFILLLQVVPARGARALAIWTAMSSNFWLNRRLTFSYARSGPLLRQYVTFCLSCLLGAAVNWSLFAFLHSNWSLFTTHPILAALCGIGAGTIFNFVMSKYVAFR